MSNATPLAETAPTADHLPESPDPILPPGAKLPFVLLASCFLWWAIANNLTDPLVKVFKEIFGMSTFQASLIQMAFYGGYFCMALPGALIARKFTYKTGVLVGLGIYAAGCFLLYPAMLSQAFLFFCVAYYVLACGLGVLETNANPYVLALGSEPTATRRLNFAQAFNPIGAVLGIVLCQVLVMARLPQDNDGNLSIQASQASSSLTTVIIPYLSVAAVLALVWIAIFFTRMPVAKEDYKQIDLAGTVRRLFGNGNYVFSVVAQFCYVGTQISVWTYTNFYIPEAIDVSQETALRWHTGALILFGVMRWVFVGLMIRFQETTLLLFAAVMASLATAGVIFIGGMVGVISLVCISGFMSMMFPTIFGLGCSDLGEDTKLASSGQIMAIVGGAVITPLQGWMEDSIGVHYSYLLPLGCFLVIGAYAIFKRIHQRASSFSKETSATR
ncbi:MAG: L-fucose:H+ symporter permease [Planctomycetota bacterium]